MAEIMSETGVAAQIKKLFEKTIEECTTDYHLVTFLFDDVSVVLATQRQQLRAYFTELNDESKIVLDEIERGCFKRPKDIFDRMFDLAENLRQQIMGGGVEATTP